MFYYGYVVTKGVILSWYYKAMRDVAMILMLTAGHSLIRESGCYEVLIHPMPCVSNQTIIFYLKSFPLFSNVEPP